MSIALRRKGGGNLAAARAAAHDEDTGADFVVALDRRGESGAAHGERKAHQHGEAEHDDGEHRADREDQADAGKLRRADEGALDGGPRIASAFTMPVTKSINRSCRMFRGSAASSRGAAISAQRPEAPPADAGGAKLPVM